MSDSAFLQGIHHAYAQTDGSYKWPNSREGDLLREAKREIDALIQLLAESQVWNAKSYWAAIELPKRPGLPKEEALRCTSWRPVNTPNSLSDSTALDAAIAKAKREGGVEALMDAAKMMRIYQYFKFSDELIRMADELKGGEQ